MLEIKQQHVALRRTVVLGNLLRSCLRLSPVPLLLSLYESRAGVKDPHLLCQVGGGSLDLRSWEVPTLVEFFFSKSDVPWGGQQGLPMTPLVWGCSHHLQWLWLHTRFQGSLSGSRCPNTACQLIRWLWSYANTGQFVGLIIKKSSNNNNNFLKNSIDISDCALGEDKQILQI